MEVVFSARAEPTGRNKLFLDYSKSKKTTDGPGDFGLEYESFDRKHWIC